MTVVKKTAGILLPMTVTDGVAVNVLPDDRYEYLMPTREVAAGYGVSAHVVRQTMCRHFDELIEGKHYLSSVTICHAAHSGSSKGTMWTKSGVVRLGFFIKSDRSRLFRDWAENLILAVMGHKQPSVDAPRPRRINRLTPDRIIDILSDVCLIEDKALRERIVGKLMGGHDYAR